MKARGNEGLLKLYNAETMNPEHYDKVLAAITSILDAAESEGAGAGEHVRDVETNDLLRIFAHCDSFASGKVAGVTQAQIMTFFDEVKVAAEAACVGVAADMHELAKQRAEDREVVVAGGFPDVTPWQPETLFHPLIPPRPRDPALNPPPTPLSARSIPLPSAASSHVKSSKIPKNSVTNWSKP